MHFALTAETLFLFGITLSVCAIEQSKNSAGNQNHINAEESAKRTRRDLQDLDALQSDGKFVAKRMRDFVGKRMSDAADFQLDEPQEGFAPDDDGDAVKRIRELVGKRTYEDDMLLADKRLREFVGKRLMDEPEMDKRFRDFVGKRFEEDNPPEKRLREFVGKRSDDMMVSDDYNKRMREFVGKRLEPNVQAEMDKRFRDFVGKRNYDFPRVAIRPRYFIRKPKYVRELIGKRSSSFPLYGSAYGFEKRMRDFVGK